MQVHEMQVQVKKLNHRAKMPTRGSKEAAGYDLYACLPCQDQPLDIAEGETQKIGTGLAVKIPDGYFGAIFARSGLATKFGLRPANCVGVIDSDYTGECIVALHNDSSCRRQINDGDRIAQLVILPYYTAEFKEVDELQKTDRGNGGFGHSGK